MNESFLIFFGVVALFLLFSWKAGKTFPLVYLFLFVYFVQYIFSVSLIYQEFPVLKRQMPISEKMLFSYLVPAMVSLFCGVFLFNKDVPLRELLKKIEKKDAERMGHLLVAISFVIDFLPSLGIPGLGSIISFTYFLKFSGAMCYVFAPSLVNNILIVVVYATLARAALVYGVFIDFFIWVACLFFIVALKSDLSFRIRTAILLAAFPFLIIIQAIKSEYRSAADKGQSGLGTIVDLAQQKQEKENILSSKSEGIERTVGRLNQGWHVARVLNWVPRREPFSEGEDFIGDLVGTVLPRILFQNKKTIGSQDKFKKYTGFRLIGSTSMTIGVLGDFYVNFGWWGSFVALFIFGAVMARLLYWFTIRYVLPNPINIVWIPFLFTYLVRANNDFYIIVNNIFKGLIIFFAIEYLRKQIWPERQHSLR